MVRSVERTVDLLEALAGGGSLSLANLARTVRAPKSTLLSIARSLLARGLLAYDPGTRTYRLGPGIGRLGLPAPLMDLSALAKPHLDRLAQRTEETAFLTVRDGDEVIYTAKAGSPRPVQYIAELGVRRPLHATASGKAWLAYMSDAEVHAYVRRTGLRRYTPSTITRAADLFRELVLIRRRGWALNRGQFVDELFGIAAPVRSSSDRVVASVNVGGPLFRLGRRAPELAREAIAAANAIAADVDRLGGNVRVSG